MTTKNTREFPFIAYVCEADAADGTWTMDEMRGKTIRVIVLGIDRRGESCDVWRYLELDEPAYVNKGNGEYAHDGGLRRVDTRVEAQFGDTPDEAIVAMLRWDMAYHERCRSCCMANLEVALESSPR